MKLSIIVPAYNEQDNIKEVIDKIERSLDTECELVVVNDHSTDATREFVEELMPRYNNIKLVENKLNRGFANALRTGFNNATSELVIPVMADLCDDLSTSKKMLQKINEGYDVVCGSRYIQGGARLGGPGLKSLLSNIGGRSLHFLLDIPTYDIANSFKMYKKKVIDSINIKAKYFEVSMEIVLKAYYSGFKITEVPTVWRERSKGKSSFRIFKLLPGYLRLYIWAIYKKLMKKKCR